MNPDAAHAREVARDVLSERRFHGLGIPHPFSGILRWLGDRLQPIADALHGLGTVTPGGPRVMWTVLAVVVVALAAFAARRMIRRAALAPGGGAMADATRESPRELEREAAAAERAGDFERAVRLRFHAGLLRLDARRTIAYRPSLTTGEVAAALGSPEFARVGERFDAIIYGGSPATADDAAAVRAAWAAVG